MAKAVAAEFLSEIVSGFDAFDIHKPEVDEYARRPFGRQFAGHFMNMREWMFFKKVSQETYGNFEINRYHEDFEVQDLAAGHVAGTDLTITISTDSLDAQNRFYPRKGDSVFFKNETVGRVWDVITTVPTAPQLVIKPNDETRAFPDLAAGENLSIISSAFSEASGQPDAALSGASYFDNDIQIIKETISVSGSEMTNQTWLTLDGFENAAYYWEGQEQLDYRMALKIDGAIQFETRTTNPTAIDPDTNNKVLTTEGVYPYARRRANPYPQATASTTLADFDAVDLIMEAFDSGNMNCVLAGANRHIKFENLLFDAFKDTNINYARQVLNDELYGGALSQELSVDFKVYNKAGRYNMLKRNRNFSNPKTFGADGYGMKDWALFYPLNKYVDGLDGEEYETMGYRYKELGGYNRMMEVWAVGGARNMGGQRLTQFDKDDLYQRANIGAHNACGQQWLLMTP